MQHIQTTNASRAMGRLALLAALCGVGASVGAQEFLPQAGVRASSGAYASVLGLDANAYAYSMGGTWWGLAASAQPGFDASKRFAELWLHPRWHATYDLGSGAQLYGSLSMGLTKDLGTNAFDLRGQSDAQLENGFVGLRGQWGDGWKYALSAGRQSFVLGTGMLLYAGSANGAEWGNAASAKRMAWKRTAVLRIERGPWFGQVFHLEPNELDSARSNTRLQGASLEWKNDPQGKWGVAFLHVPESDFVYPGDLAPLSFLEKGRQGLKVYHGWGEWNNLVPSLPGLSVRGDFALERGAVTRLSGERSAMDAHAFYVGASQWFQTLPFAPKLSYGYGYFSGDDRNTSKYERFDPLYWGNGLDNWWFGANGSYAFINSNVRFQRFTLDGYLSQRDILKLQYVRSYAARTNSPIQFGQAVRFPVDGFLPAVGVDRAHLASEWMLQYVHLFTPTLVFSAYVSRSVPGEGLRRLAGSQSRSWTAVGAGVSYSF